MKNKWRPLEAARTFARKKGFKGRRDWQAFAKTADRPSDIPAAPKGVYKDEGWAGWPDFLGTTRLSFEAARTFARKKGFKGRRDWQAFTKTAARPSDIPTDPAKAYKDQGWAGWPDFLGVDVITWRPFKEARAFARGLGLKTGADWRAYTKSPARPSDIPTDPAKAYKDQGWAGWPDFLGVEVIAWRPFEEARTFARGLGFKKRQDWFAFTKTSDKPPDIPTDPYWVYKSQGWISYRDFLGTTWRPFKEARAFARGLGLKTGADWRAYTKSPARPSDIPTDPAKAYKDQGWAGWPDFLGVEVIAWRPFEEARTFARGLGLKTITDWHKFAKSKPEDIPAQPSRIYKNSGWKNWPDFLGTTWRSFEEARMFARGLGLKTALDWTAYAKTSEKPRDIPANPFGVYKDQGWTSYPDFLGVEVIAWRPFEEARTFARGLGFKSKTAWYAHAKSRPTDIPYNPDTVYKNSGWKNWPDFLGTTWRSFEEARTFARRLGLQKTIDWKAFAKSPDRPPNVPADPDRFYRNTGWTSYPDFLGVEVIDWRPFEAARTFVQGLGLKSAKDWWAYTKSPARPADIPTAPDKSYKNKGWRSWQDWLGVVNVWTRAAVLQFIEDLRPLIPTLSKPELYQILRQGGVLPAMQAGLGGVSVMDVLRDLEEDNGANIVDALSGAADDDIPGSADEPNTEIDVVIPRDEDSPTSIDDDGSPLDSDEGANLPAVESAAGLRAIDDLAALPYGCDDETIEAMITNRVHALWALWFKHGHDEVEARLAGDGGPWFTELKKRFLDERDAVNSLPIPKGWSFRDLNDDPQPPNLMQRRAAYLVQARQRVGNWSGVGTGKTLSAVLASRVCECRVTVVVTNNATVDQWKDVILNAYPDSCVVTNLASPRLKLDRSRCNYVVVNYEKFQIGSRTRLIRELLRQSIDFIVLDEVQYSKQRYERPDLVSQRRHTIEAFLSKATEQNTDLRVLTMTATPVINNFREGRKLLELTLGTEFPDLKTRPTVNNGLALHSALMLYGFRQRADYTQEMRETCVSVTRNDLLDELRRASGDILTVEQLLVEPRLEAVRRYLKPGVVIFTQYVHGIIGPIRKRLEAMGFRVGLYTGADKSGLELFKRQQVDILLGSEPVGTGLDGLQKRCNRIIMLSLPWTGAHYEQIIGRVRRPGSSFGEVEIVIPQVFLDYEGERWSWDQRRMEAIQRKQTLSDCATEGVIPKSIEMNRGALLRQSREALDRWRTRISQEGLTTLARPRLVVPLPPDLLEPTRRRVGDFTEINRRWSVTQSTKTYVRLQGDPSEWYLYHTQYRQAREAWSEHPTDVIARHLQNRPEWVIGDFGCGECLLGDAIPNKVQAFDYIAIDDRVTACDISSTPLENATLDVAVFSLSLMGTNWRDYLHEAHRTLRPRGQLFIAEPQGKWEGKIEELTEVISSIGFRLVGSVEQREHFLYLEAIKS